MKLQDLDQRMADLNKLTIHPKTEYKSRPTPTQSFFHELSLFLNNPKNDDLVYFLVRKYILKR